MCVGARDHWTSSKICENGSTLLVIKSVEIRCTSIQKDLAVLQKAVHSRLGGVEQGTLDQVLVA
jgi:predicted DNA-binding transcriptional regulator